MEKEDKAVKSKTRIRRVVKIVAFGSVCLMALLFLVHTIWRMSGSNRWQLVQDESGIKVYTLKTPGSDLIQVKGTVRVHSTLGGIVKFMVDPATCSDYGCYDSHTVERVDDQLQYNSFRFPTPFPFKTRELVVRSQIDQNPQTKEVLLVVAAAPDKTPPSDCCFRVTQMNNTWQLTPLGNQEVEIEYVMNMNEGGSMPDLMLNWERPRLVFSVLQGLQRLIIKENYQNLALGFIAEK